MQFLLPFCVADQFRLFLSFFSLTSGASHKYGDKAYQISSKYYCTSPWINLKSHQNSSDAYRHGNYEASN